ncbi:helix-hairpin-helix domain-containing protein [Echinicola strongylocentroti]|uniref:Helix-hairpin-helix domain-containing protein n=1 Tax=Echinicola strongylocentroti TaxID=1795355 RepID=A0A2Z4ILX2_9BACT|nr:helix-hairpin-helix domain-containing protein [Echinicola strongylocentroti]AWW31717.1 helix-hairpin-helix domain-containing protein [Echinicola strongylocentroti]
MKKYKIIFIVFLVIISTDRSHAQDSFDIEAFAEELFSLQEEDLDYEQLYENLLQRYLNPIDLNSCSPDDLQSIYILTPLQVTDFFKYRNVYGKFLSIYELQAIPSFDAQTIKKLEPFVSLDDNAKQFSQPLSKRMLTEKTAYFIYRHRVFMEKRKGFTVPDTLSNGSLTNRYQGPPGTQYLRFRTQHSGDFSMGITLDRDAGEEFTWDPSTRRFGFNFLSYHFTLYDKGPWKQVTLGDYQAQYGQGLVFGAGFSVGKGAETITTTRRSSTGIKPYTSSMETGFFRGAAATYQKGRFEGSLMASSLARDANIDTTLTPHQLTSLPQNGYHRTTSEISRKAASTEQNLGVNINYSSGDKNLQIGINSLTTRFPLTYNRDLRIYNGFEFRGKVNHIHSTYFSYNYQNHFFFGEAALSKSKGTAYVAGIMSSLSQQLDIVLHIRDYDRNFHSFYGNAFGEGSRPINERGIYLGLSYHPSKKLQWSGYYDQFKFPWIRYRLYAPSSGHEWLQRISYRPSKAMELYFQIREEVKDRNVTATHNDLPTYRISTGKKYNYLLNLDTDLSEYVSLRSRVQVSSFDYDQQLTKGYTIVQDLNVEFKNWRWSGRIALFDTDDYDNRQYVYEKNVLWAFSIPSYYGQGMRYYILTQYKPMRKLTLWLRWARTSYTDRNTISSGLQEVKGKHLSELTFQVRYQFNR